MLGRGRSRLRLGVVRVAFACIRGRLPRLVRWTRCVVEFRSLTAVASSCFVGVSRAVELVLLARIAERSLTWEAQMNQYICSGRCIDHKVVRSYRYMQSSSSGMSGMPRQFVSFSDEVRHNW